MEAQKNLTEIGAEILSAARSQLYLNITTR